MRIKFKHNINDDSSCVRALLHPVAITLIERAFKTNTSDSSRARGRTRTTDMEFTGCNRHENECQSVTQHAS
jgi:hypothetical protein